SRTRLGPGWRARAGTPDPARARRPGAGGGSADPASGRLGQHSGRRADPLPAQHPGNPRGRARPSRTAGGLTAHAAAAVRTRAGDRLAPVAQVTVLAADAPHSLL